MTTPFTFADPENATAVYRVTLLNTAVLPTSTDPAGPHTVVMFLDGSKFTGLGANASSTMPTTANRETYSVKKAFDFVPMINIGATGGTIYYTGVDINAGPNYGKFTNVPGNNYDIINISFYAGTDGEYTGTPGTAGTQGTPQYEVYRIPSYATPPAVDEMTVYGTYMALIGDHRLDFTLDQGCVFEYTKTPIDPIKLSNTKFNLSIPGGRFTDR